MKTITIYLSDEDAALLAAVMEIKRLQYEQQFGRPYLTTEQGYLAHKALSGLELDAKELMEAEHAA